MKYNEFFFIYAFFGNSFTGQTCRRIFTPGGSNDADSRRGVSFGGLIFDLAPHFEGEIPPYPTFWVSIDVFKPNGQTIERLLLSKLYHRFQPNFAQE